MGLFKKEVLVTTSLQQKNEVVDLLEQNNIRAYIKTKDNFSGGLYTDRRYTGSLGMDISSRFIYSVYVAKKNYEEAEFLLRKNSK